jgi:predicted PurR-regulated permease PerM
MYRAAIAGGMGKNLAGRLASVRLAILLLPFARRMRRNGKRIGRAMSVLLLLAAGMAAVAGISGCGSNDGFFALQQKTYSVTITGTAGSLSHSGTVSLTVE